MKKAFLLLLIFATLFTACKKDEENTEVTPGIVVPDEKELAQTAYADEENTGGGFTFTAKNDWGATVSPFTRASNITWLKLLYNGVEKYSGVSGTFKLAIELEPNYSGSARAASIVIQSGTDKITIIVEQDAVTKENKVPVDPHPVTAVAINKQLITRMEVGDTAILKATVTPTEAKIKSVSWSSINESVIKIDPVTGKVTAIAKGSAMIVVRSSAYRDVRDTFKITVVEKGAFETITLNKTEMELEVGVSDTLVATVNSSNSDKTVKWSSSDPSVATVDASGKVTVIALGKDVTITATAVGGATATCKVITLETVLVAPKFVFSLSTQPSFTVTKAGQTGTQGVFIINLDGVGSNQHPTGYISLIINTSNTSDETLSAGTYQFSEDKSSPKSFSSSGMIATTHYTCVGGTVTVGFLPNGLYRITLNIEAVDANNNRGTITGTYEGALAKSSVTLNKALLTMEVGDTETLIATVSSGSASGGVSWYSNDSDIDVDIQTGKVTAKDIGKFEIKAVAPNGDVAVCFVTVTSHKVTGKGSFTYSLVSNAFAVNYASVSGTQGTFEVMLHDVTGLGAGYLRFIINTGNPVNKNLVPGTYQIYGSGVGLGVQGIIDGSKIMGTNGVVIVKLSADGQYQFELDVVTTNTDQQAGKIAGTYTGTLRVLQ